MRTFRRLHITSVHGDLAAMDGALTLPAPLSCTMEAMMDASRHSLERDIVSLVARWKDLPERLIRCMSMRA